MIKAIKLKVLTLNLIMSYIKYRGTTCPLTLSMIISLKEKRLHLHLFHEYKRTSTHLYLVHVPVSVMQSNTGHIFIIKKHFTVGQDYKNIIMVLNVSHEALNKNPGSCAKA